MRAFIFLSVTLVSAAAALADDSASINKLIGEIDVAAKTNKSHMLSILILNTDVAGPTLEKEALRHHFTLGEVYVAHSIALAAHKSFAQIAAMKKGDVTWGKVAQLNKVSLRGATNSIKELMRSKNSDEAH